MFHVGIDIGGTFTDCVLIGDPAKGGTAAYRTAKALSTSGNPADAVLDRADATRVYAVAWDSEGPAENKVDETGTERLREERLRARLAAAASPSAAAPPRQAAAGADLRPVGGDLGVLLDDGRPVEWVSLTGRARLGQVTEDYRAACAVRQTPVNAQEPEFGTRAGRPGAAMLLREYLCPVSGVRLATELIRDGDDPAPDMVLAGGPP